MPIDGKTKLTKELVAQEARFILDSVMSAGQYGKQAPLDELRHRCEQSVSLRLLDYLSFLERFGYLSYDRNSQLVQITADGERVVGGERLAELVIDVVHHFRPLLVRSRGSDEAPAAAGTSRRGADGRELIDDRYEKLKELGSGGIGTVYLARQSMLDRPVALKEIRELFGFFTEPQRLEIIRRFDEEVLRAAQLSHPNIAVVLDANTSREYPYVVTELVVGGSLRRILKHAEAIPPEYSVKVILQALHALRHAHSKGVLHRGIKPENILLDATGNVRLTDFGLSRVVERDQAVIQHVYVGMGSVAYMAPELFVDPQSVGPQSDLYALGIVLYEMLARKLPGRRSPMPTKLHPSLPKIVDDIFDKLTQDERADRYPSAEAVLEDFYKAEESKGFSDARCGVIFLESPIAKLQLKPGAETELTPEETLAKLAELPRVDAALPTQTGPVEGLPLPEVPLSPLPSSASRPLGGSAPQLAPPSMLSVDPLAPPEEPYEEGFSEPEIDDGTDRPKRRRPVRPYSFQQRIKDRDK